MANGNDPPAPPAPVVTYEMGVEWALGSGTWPCQGPNCPPPPPWGEADHVHPETFNAGGGSITGLQQVPGDPSITTYDWPDTVCGFVDGPSPLTNCTAMAKPYVDTCTTTTDPDTGEETKVCVRAYPPYAVTAVDNGAGMTMESSLPPSPRQFDPNNNGTGSFPYIRPTQFGGCILYHERNGPKETGDNEHHRAWAVAGIADMADSDGPVTLGGFIPTGAGANSVPLDFPANDYLITLNNGAGFIWQHDRMFRMDVEQPIIAVDMIVPQVLNLPCEAALGTTALVSVPPFDVTPLEFGVGGALYYAAPNSTDDANLDPFPEWFQVTDPPPTVLSGYSYLDVFDEAEMEYVERCSHQMTEDYEGEISIRREGYFPTQPLDPGFVWNGRPNPLYPMDSVTKFIPDQREEVTVSYTVGFTATFEALAAQQWVSETITVHQKVLAPQEDWADLLEALLDTCYFTHGYYESYEWVTRPDSNYIPMDNIPIRNCERDYYQ